MNISIQKFITSFVIISCLTAGVLKAELSIYCEGAYAYPSYSDISIPKSRVNEFSLTDDLSANSRIAYRTEIRYFLNKNNQLAILIAPLSITAEGILPKNLQFNGNRFNKGDDIEALFRFDSYRLKYRYFFKRNNRYFKAIGFTAKIRDAEISLETNSQKSQKLNTGFVPLINFLIEFPIHNKLNLNIDGDALFSPYGRAEDIFTGLTYDYNPDININCGYRVVEGGSNVEAVYSFSWINYFLIALEYRLF